jgi:transposase
LDRGKSGSKHHVITDANGIPLASPVTAANVNDVSEFAPLFNKLPEVAGKAGRPRRRPDALQGDLAYDSEPHRQGLREMGIESLLPEKGIDEDAGLGETRWPVEGTLSWAHRNRRLRVRYERRTDIHQAFLTLAMIKICASALFSGFSYAVSGPVTHTRLRGGPTTGRRPRTTGSRPDPVRLTSGPLGVLTGTPLQRRRRGARLKVGYQSFGRFLTASEVSRITANTGVTASRTPLPGNRGIPGNS